MDPKKYGKAPYPPAAFPPGRSPKRRGPEAPSTPPSPAAVKALIALGVVFVLLLIYAVGRSTTTPAQTADAGTPFTAALIAGEGAQRRTVDADSFAAVTTPCDISSRDMLIFGTSTRNVITLPDGASLRFADAAEVNIDGLKKSGDTYQVGLTLIGGRLWVAAGPASRFEVRSGKKAVIKSSGDAVFEVSQKVDEKAYAVTTVRVYKGTADLSGLDPKSERVTIASGQAGRMNDDKMFPTEAFDATRSDEWVTWNLAYQPSTDPPPAAVAAPPTAQSRTATSGGASGSVPAAAAAARPPVSTAPALRPQGPGLPPPVAGQPQPRPAPASRMVTPVYAPASQPQGPPRLAQPVYAPQQAPAAPPQAPPMQHQAPSAPPQAPAAAAADPSRNGLSEPVYAPGAKDGNGQSGSTAGAGGPGNGNPPQGGGMQGGSGMVDPRLPSMPGVPRAGGGGGGGGGGMPGNGPTVLPNQAPPGY